MTREDAAILEREFAISFPPDYLSAITDGYPFAAPSEQLDTDAKSLRLDNHGARNEEPWGFTWKNSYWMVGGDGAGGFYFIDTSKDDSTVYYCDHEDMPKSIDDEDRICVTSFAQYVKEGIEADEEAEIRDRLMKVKVDSRKWWQFWIPKSWPPEH